MAFMKRIVLFMLTNLLVIVTISIVLNLLGVGRYITAQGINYETLMIFCLVWGMGGAFISLGLSRIMAKWMMGVKVIDPNTSDPRLADLVQTVHHLAQAAGLQKMPEVGVYDSPELNAFATGPTKNRSLVAVSTGLLYRMNRDEVEGVLGHEVAHIANGDMVTMTLVQGVINAFVMFFARILAYVVSQALSGNRDGEESNPSPMLHFFLVMAFEIAFSLLGMIVVAAFSRYREYRADAGGAQLAGRHKMVAALKALAANMQIPVPEDKQASVATMKIFGRGKGLAAMMSTHPPLEERIRRLEQYVAA
jgi:heat shock protein HtpX